VKGLCPKAEELYDSMLSLPLYPKMNEGDVWQVIDAVRKLRRLI
jgi:dTDP-4-amino-4,6-dideoxygalactose transaminase